MKPNGLLIGVGALAVLAIGIFFSNKQQAAKQKNPTDATKKIVSIPDDQFQEIKIQKTGAEPLDLKKENGKWAITQPKPLPADSDSVSSLVSTLGGVSADTTVEDKPADLSAYGLNKPSL